MDEVGCVVWFEFLGFIWRDYKVIYDYINERKIENIAFLNFGEHKDILWRRNVL